MARELDIKALISHIITGDGIDRCRICMGDTSDGQVFLEDTVLMEDDSPLSLGELLKSVTGVEVPEDCGLPKGVCKSCYESIASAFNTKRMILRSLEHWNNVGNLVENTLKTCTDDTQKAFYIVYNYKLINPKNIERKLCFANETVFVRNKKFKKLSKTKLQCPDCSKMFHVKQQLNKHLANTNNRSCEICGDLMPRDKLKTHMLKRHRISLVNCNLCYELFDNDSLLREHDDACHGENSETCTVCGKSFTVGTRSLQSHMYSHSVFYCDGCGKSFENRQCAQHHKRVCNITKKSTPLQLYQCDDCGQVYNKKISLRAHITQKHSNILPFKCSFCDKRTSTATHLAEHELTHNLDRQIFECKQCPAKFKSKLGYKLHLKSHTGEKNYMCSKCGETFVSASRRSDHVKRQHKAMRELPHGCPHCPARFIRPVMLRKHLKDAHSALDETEVLDETDCPKGACAACFDQLLGVYRFITAVKKAKETWKDTLNALETLSLQNTRRTIHAFLKTDPVKFHFEFANKTYRLIKSVKRKTVHKRSFKRSPDDSGPCRCPFCNRGFKQPSRLSNHLQFSPQIDVCLICGLVFKRGDELELESHMKDLHDTATYKCKECGQLFLYEDELEVHLKNDHKPGSLTCGDCGKQFNKVSVYEAHTQMHAVRTCRVCGAQFSNRACYRVHRSQCEPKPNLKSLPRYVRSNIRDQAIFTCDYCQKTYSSRPQLKNHIVWKHLDIRPHQCDVCKKKFHTLTRLTEHSVVHTRDRKFTCDICGAKLVTKLALVYHRRRHTGEKPYECEECGEKFISSSRLSEHAKRRHKTGVMYVCTVCQKLFVRKKELEKHMSRSHKSKNDDEVVFNDGKNQQFAKVGST